jgi:hypothetical protein
MTVILGSLPKVCSGGQEIVTPPVIAGRLPQESRLVADLAAARLSQKML